MLRTISLALLATGFVLAGANHFRAPDLYLPLMPGWLPWHRPLIAISGAAEILGGVGLAFPATRRLAGWWLIALLAAVFPANVHMLIHDVPLGGNHLPAWLLWLRLPLQPLLMAWIWWGAKKTMPRESPEGITRGMAG